MYTILVNDDKTLTTTVATLLFRGESVQPIQVLIKDGFYQLNFDKVEVIAKCKNSLNTPYFTILEKIEDIYKDDYHRFILKMDENLFKHPNDIQVSFKISQIDGETGESISLITDSTIVSIRKHEKINRGCEDGTTDYSELSNKPKINGVIVDGDLSSDELHINIDITQEKYDKLSDEEKSNGATYYIVDGE